MTTLGKLILEVIAICGIAVGLGLSVNAIRARNSLTLERNYFPTVKVKASQPASVEPIAVASTPPEVRVNTSPAANDETIVTSPGDDADDALSVQVVAFDLVRQWFEDPDSQVGGILFVDARNDEHYRDGHIPGAVRLDHYSLDQDLQKVLALAEAVETIVVYCNGVDCEDSLFVARDLIDAGVFHECIYLYEGGWHEWEQMEMPVENGEGS